MSSITRRDILKSSAGLLGLAAIHSESGHVAEILGAPGPAAGRLVLPEVGKPDLVATDIYFHESNVATTGSNNGWVIFDDYVLVIDASYPAGAQEILTQIRAITDKPVRFAFDTHHHGDHAYGNQVLVESGATAVGHTGVIEEMKRYETGYYGGKPGRWEQTAGARKDVQASRLKPPSVLFPKELIFDDGKHRVELHHLGIAHTHGDAFAWLPNERILFTGDACVAGPYNFVGDGNVEQWIATLDAARKLGARVVCPGHGPRGDADVLKNQQDFFKQLRDKVGAMVSAKKSPEQIRDSVEAIGAELSSNPNVGRYVSKGSLPGQVQKVLTEMTGQRFPEQQKPGGSARLWHAHHHGLYHLG